MRRWTRVRAAVAGCALLALVAAAGCGGPAAQTIATSHDVEVFTWWAAGGEKAGLDGLVKSFETACPGEHFVNGAIDGGAGADAKAVLGARLSLDDPPETFQVHAGVELTDYLASGKIQDLSSQYQQWGLLDVLPKGLLDTITISGHIYSVPANIHRANVLWGNRAVLAHAGVTGPAGNLTAFFTDLDKVRRAGVQYPLALGKDWTQEMLFEALLISELGADRFQGLWTGATSWAGADLTQAVKDYKKLLGYTNPDRDRYDWTDAEQLLVNGRAAYQLMGDWEAADLDARGFTGYSWSAFPGNAGVYQWLADSFVLPTGARNVTGTLCWLKTVGSAEGQKAFNTKKGSIPARTDANPADYPAYQRSAIAEWKTDTQVPSCPHGSACTQRRQQLLAAAQTRFSADGNVAALQQALVDAARSAGHD
jgi:glucose/mannose transport system substrate-binding protein